MKNKKIQLSLRMDETLYNAIKAEAEKKSSNISKIIMEKIEMTENSNSVNKKDIIPILHDLEFLTDKIALKNPGNGEKFRKLGKRIWNLL